MAKQGGQTKKPRRITITIPEVYAEDLDRLAAEGKVTVSALCANIVTRYALQDRSLLANDVIAERLEQQAERHAADLEKRIGDLLAVTALHTIAGRRQGLLQVKAREGEEAAKQLGDVAWGYAVRTLRKYGRDEPGGGEG